MKIKMQDSRFGKNGDLLEAGKTYDMENYEAKRLIAKHYAVAAPDTAYGESADAITTSEIIASIQALDLAAEIEAYLTELPANLTNKARKAVAKAAEERIKELRGEQ